MGQGIGYPLLLEPCYDEKIWGGRRLAEVLHKPLPTRARYGESLESGDDAVVANGPLAGRTLGDLSRAFPAALLGERGVAASAPFDDFPLLVKFIDASDVLSLQVHPDDAGARPLGKRGKTEAWYVVHAEPGAELITGLRAPVEVDAIRRAIADGSFEALIERRQVRPGDLLLVPPGTIHAIGGGILLYEIQENSDVTFRLYDWGRVDAAGRPRPLHLDQALAATDPGSRAAPVAPLALDPIRTVLAACRYFALERWSVDGEWAAPLAPGASFRLLTALAGACAIRVDGVEVALEAGRTVLLPADLKRAALAGRASLLCGWVPNLAGEIVAPLRAAGHAPAAIAQLDGGTGDLAAALTTGERA